MTNEFENGVQFLMTYGDVSRQRATDLMKIERIRKGVVEAMSMSPEQAADAWRDKQAQKILDVFERSTGKPAASTEELEDWIKSPEGKLAMAPHHDARGKVIL